VAFLEAVSAGDDRAVELATKLADLVLDASGARLALATLEGGPLTRRTAPPLFEGCVIAEGVFGHHRPV
jgi:hypothetical protein